MSARTRLSGARLADPRPLRRTSARGPLSTRLWVQALVTSRVSGLIPAMRAALGLADDPAPPRRASVKGSDSLSLKLQRQMAQLMAVLRRAEPRYVRRAHASSACVTPSRAKDSAASRGLVVASALHLACISRRRCAASSRT